MTDESLNEHQKIVVRQSLVDLAASLIGIPYLKEAEWTDYSKFPEALDCSEMIEGVFRKIGLRMPDGSQNQYDFCVDIPKCQNGDLGFFGKGASSSKIYHVGIVWNGLVIEAREHDPKASFETGKVITRPVEKWKAFSNFVGFRSQPKLV